MALCSNYYVKIYIYIYYEIDLVLLFFLILSYKKKLQSKQICMLFTQWFNTQDTVNSFVLMEAYLYIFELNTGVLCYCCNLSLTHSHKKFYNITQILHIRLLCILFKKFPRSHLFFLEPIDVQYGACEIYVWR